MLSTLRNAARSPRIVAPYHRLRPSKVHRTYASVTNLESLPRPGEQLHGFTLQRKEHVPELDLSALHFKHDKTGADYLHIARDDTNNVFSIGFKTNPPDATGVPHILEHTTLCGSEKYPVRDPFFKMLPRSLQNFMNAFTSSDHTMYPFATTNGQDFRNLMSVYLDATLHPLLKQTDFVQEGWRIGPENPQAPAKDDKGSDLVFKGVVYNEMKGQMSDASYLFFIRFYEHIFPSINNSGGDPSKMTDLTYEQLRNFHQDHYHPSNAKILTYGDQDVKDHLKFLGESLANFDKRTVDQDLKSAIELSDGSKTVTVKGPVDPLTPPNAQYKTSVTWLVGDPNDVVESFALNIALNVLLDGYGSPLYRALIESGLGSDFAPNTGYVDSGRRAVFSIGLSGVKKEDVANVKQAITTSLKETIKKGLDKHKIDGNLHQLELGLKHKTAKFGLNIVQRITAKWFNDQDPFDALEVKRVLDAFKTNYAKPGYLEGLLEKYLLTENTLTFTMEPSTTFAVELAEEEANRLKTKIDEAVKQYPNEKEAYDQLRERELELVKEQDKGRTESVDSLPTLRVSDIPREQKKTEIRDSVVGRNAKVQWRETATNGLTYFKAMAIFPGPEDPLAISDELRMLIPLFCDSLMRIGTKEKSMEEIEDIIKLKTGGISFGHFSKTSPSNISQTEEGLSLSGFAFDSNVTAMYELLQTVLVETDFDSPQAHTMIKQLLQTGASGAVDGIASSGHGYAMKFAAAGISPEARMSEQIGGLTQVKLITQLAAREENPEAMRELVNKLKSIQGLMLTYMQNSQIRVAITCGPDAVSSNDKALQSFFTGIKNAKPSSSQKVAIEPLDSKIPNTNSHKTFFNLPYQVSYSGLALPTGPYTDPKSANFAILAKLLTHRHLHHEIREKGGAYGGGAYSKGLQGIFGMYSYRDPNPENTLSIYRDAGRWAAEHDWTERDLEEAKLGVFQGLDAPESVNQEGMVRFLSGVDYEMGQRRREWLLDVSKEGVREAAERVREKVEGEEARIAVLGDAEKQRFQKERGWKVEDMGMKGEGEAEEP